MKHLTPIYTSIVLSLLCLFPSLFNGFPLVFSDTGTYIFSGFNLSVPADRPINYGIFIFITSLGHFPFLTVFVQLFISFYCSIKLIKLYVESRLVMLIGLTTLIFLSPQVYFCNLLLSDFAALPLLCSLLIICKTESKILQLGYGLLAVFLASFHLGFLMPMLVLSCIVLVLYLFNKSNAKIYKPILLVALCTFLLLLTENVLDRSKFTTNEKGYLFLSAKLIDIGLFQKNLNEQCKQDPSFKLCQYKESIPTSGLDFMWSDQSPLYLAGGWDSLETEYRKINYMTFSNVESVKTFTTFGLIQIPAQLLNVSFGEELVAYKVNSAPYYSVRDYFPSYLNDYLNAKQQNGGLLNEKIKNFMSDVYYYTLMLIYGCLIAFTLFKFRVIQIEFKLLLLYFILSICFIALFTIPDSRYVIRLEPILLIILIVQGALFLNQYKLKRQGL